MRASRAFAAARVAVFVLAAGTVAAAVLRHGGNEPSRPAAATPEPAQRASPSPHGIDVQGGTGELRTEVALLRLQLAALQEQVAATRGAAEGPRDEALARAPAGAAAEEHEQARVDSNEASFRAEAIDAVWSAEAGAAVEEALRGAGMPRGSVRSVECRSRSCRVALAQDESQPEMAKALPLFLHVAGSRFPSAAGGRAAGADGRPSPVLYLSSR